MYERNHIGALWSLCCFCLGWASGSRAVITGIGKCFFPPLFSRKDCVKLVWNIWYNSPTKLWRFLCFKYSLFIIIVIFLWFSDIPQIQLKADFPHSASHIPSLHASGGPSLQLMNFRRHRTVTQSPDLPITSLWVLPLFWDWTNAEWQVAM